MTFPSLIKQLAPPAKPGEQIRTVIPTTPEEEQAVIRMEQGWGDKVVDTGTGTTFLNFGKGDGEESAENVMAVDNGSPYPVSVLGLRGHMEPHLQTARELLRGRR